MSRTFSLKILTPEKILFQDNVDYIKFRTPNGDRGILAGHTNDSILLDHGILTINKDEEEFEFTAMGGTVLVRKGEVTVLSEFAESPDKIDIEKAKRAKERAEARLKSSNLQIETERAEIAMRRMLMRDDFGSDY